MGANDPRKWIEDHGEVVAFAGALRDAGYFEGDDAVANVIAYFEKPWKWTDEHDRWAAAGRPDEFDFEPVAEEVD